MADRLLLNAARLLRAFAGAMPPISEKDVEGAGQLLNIIVSLEARTALASVGYEMCPKCKGSGEGYENDETGQTACTMCNGSGEVTCTQCDGRGYVYEDVTHCGQHEVLCLDCPLCVSTLPRHAASPEAAQPAASEREVELPPMPSEYELWDRWGITVTTEGEEFVHWFAREHEKNVRAALAQAPEGEKS